MKVTFSSKERNMENAEAAPTGCYKCGRPGHWSRDCPSSQSNPNPNPNSDFSKTSSSLGSGSGAPKPFDKVSEKPKKIPRTRPKLTPEILLSNDGLGYVLRHFPRAFKFRGRGYEVSDLKNLIGLYSEWHSHLLPYYSFDQFVHKVEQVGATKRVRTCIRELRDTVANGGDPTKLHEPPVGLDNPNNEQGVTDSMVLEELGSHQGDPFSENHDDKDIQEVAMLHEIYEKVTEDEPSPIFHHDTVAADTLKEGSSIIEPMNQEPDNGSIQSSKVQMTGEQKSRMEANRQKALEKAAACARSRHQP